MKFVQIVNFDENTLYGHPFHEIDNTHIVNSKHNLCDHGTKKKGLHKLGTKYGLLKG
jgi:hypothetical protein